MTQKQESPQQAAQRQLEAEEQSRKRSRLDTLTKEETERRERERLEAEREAAREAASRKSDELAEHRRKIEEKIQKQVQAVNASLAALQETDSEHRAAMMEAGTFGNHTLHRQPLSRSVDQYLQGAFPGFLRGREARPGARNPSLAVLDPLTPSEEHAEVPSVQTPDQGLVGSRVEDEPRLQSNRLLLKLIQRAGKLFVQYGRPVAWNECVAESERDEVERVLTDEQKAALSAALSGEVRRGE